MIEVYDNGGETFDRYTVIIDGDVYGMSANPNSPQGFNQYSGKLHELPMARSNGERVTIESLPEAVQKAIEDRQKSDDDKVITIVIEGGVVQEVKNLPSGYLYQIEDND